jgi:hypothetical protein
MFISDLQTRGRRYNRTWDMEHGAHILRQGSIASAVLHAETHCLLTARITASALPSSPSCRFVPQRAIRNTTPVRGPFGCSSASTRQVDTATAKILFLHCRPSAAGSKYRLAAQHRDGLLACCSDFLPLHPPRLSIQRQHAA